MKLVAALLLVCLLGLSAIYAQTDGFEVVTSESARRLAVERHPRPLPDAPVVLESGARASLLSWLRSDGRVAIVDFVYTRCISICAALGSEFQQLQAEVLRRGLSDRVRLLSISFDPADTADELTRYAQSLHADPQLWRFAGVADAAQRRELLDTFGIVVVPAPLGQFVHNAALHVVTADGRLARVVDYDAPDEALAAAVAQAARNTGAHAAGTQDAGTHAVAARAVAVRAGGKVAVLAGAPRSGGGAR